MNIITMDQPTKRNGGFCMETTRRYKIYMNGVGHNKEY